MYYTREDGPTSVEVAPCREAALDDDDETLDAKAVTMLERGVQKTTVAAKSTSMA
jgi:hypothetical protein